MNKIVEQQLKRCHIADLSHYNQAQNQYFIPRKVEVKVAEGEYYSIRIKDSLKSNTAVTINWNAGSVPTHSYYKVEIVKVMGRMIKINGIAFDPSSNVSLSNMWSGWVSIDDIEVISKI